MTGFLGGETTANFVKVQNFDKVEFEKTGTLLRELLPNPCQNRCILATTRQGDPNKSATNAFLIKKPG